MAVERDKGLTWGQTCLSLHKRSSESLENLQTFRPQRECKLAYILHTCDEPAFILSELDDPAAFEIATEPNFGNDELDVDQRRLFTDSITD